jgi:hypothetical protein
LKDAIGGESLALPPIFSSATKDKKLIDAARDINPTQKSLAELSTKFKNGDIIFIRSTSPQSRALEEVTKSKWTHVGILFNLKKKRNLAELLPSESKDGKWMVFEAGPKVRFNPVNNFVGKRVFAVLRPKKNLNERDAMSLYSTALSRVGKPYDIYFLLSNDGKTKDTPDYCSELIWYTYAKALGVVLGYQVQIGSQYLDGPEAQRLIKDRLSRPDAPMNVAQWKKQYVIPPESQFLSPLLERIDRP